MQTTMKQSILEPFGHNENKPNQQFAIIEVSAVYGDCEIELAPAYNFNARFLRPLDIESNDKAKFLDAEANGSSVLLGNLFKANAGATNRLSYTMIKTKYMKLLKKTTLTCTNTTVSAQ